VKEFLKIRFVSIEHIFGSYFLLDHSV